MAGPAVGCSRADGPSEFGDGSGDAGRHVSVADGGGDVSFNRLGSMAGDTVSGRNLDMNTIKAQGSSKMQLGMNDGLVGLDREWLSDFRYSCWDGRDIISRQS
jgi:hypothetical protein